MFPTLSKVFKLLIGRNGPLQAIFKRNGRRKSQPAADFGYVGAGMTNITGTKVRVDRLGPRADQFPDVIVKRVQRDAFPRSDVEYLADRSHRFGSGCEQIRGDDIFDKYEITRGFAVSEDRHLFAAQQGMDPAGNHRRIGAVRILVWTKHVEVAQADGLDAEYIGVQFIHELRERVRGQEAPGVCFGVWQLFRVA